MPTAVATQPGRRTRVAAPAPTLLPEPARAGRAAGPPAVLSPRQLETLTLFARGASDKQVGRLLHISKYTVHHHLERARERLGATHTAHAIAVAIRLGLIDLDDL